MGSKGTLHPSVQKFKTFVSEHPGVSREIKNGPKSLQDFYEEWSVLGPNHEQWEAYKQTQSETESTDSSKSKEETKSSSGASTGEMVSQLMGLVKKMNVEDLQNHLTQFSTVLGNVQNLMQSFQRPSESTHRQESDYSPFSFRRD
ncbi:YlbD family protein [Shouchella shacheensis]|uniref:YlbD family protein n=1 Tax=Shouchella shacheensis TaxID=1649580 RepID=UPI00073FF8BD|nr:YlbD family protein [Shouchella shacheensis]